MTDINRATQTDKLAQPDVAAFLQSVRQSHFFQPHAPVVISRAPGRLDVMGGIADYSGSLVLQLPIAEATFVALQRDTAPVLRIRSRGTAGEEARAEFCLPLSELPPTYEAARAHFARDSRTAWAAYAAGALLVLLREEQATLEGGLRLLIASDVPEGKGVSSSAALEVAVMQAMAAALNVPLSARRLALLCQMVENRVVGAPCGVMDQMTSAAGQANHLLALLCQPAEIQGNLPIPEDIAFFGIDSGLRHSVSGADYGTVRAAAFMGYRILADAVGLSVEKDGTGVRIADPPWDGYLANITPSYFAQHLEPHLPAQMQGSAFLERYCGTTDRVTQIHPERAYPVRAATSHPIYEHFRVRAFAQILQCPGETSPPIPPLAQGSASASLWTRSLERSSLREGSVSCSSVNVVHVDSSEESRMELLGELMYQSHASYSACGLGSEGTDQLVHMVREAGHASGLYGAKITGGGSGGTVAILARRNAEAEATVREIAKRYAAQTGRASYVFTSSSPGADHWGTHLFALES